MLSEDFFSGLVADSAAIGNCGWLLARQRRPHQGQMRISRGWDIYRAASLFGDGGVLLNTPRGRDVSEVGWSVGARTAGPGPFAVRAWDLGGDCVKMGGEY